MNSLNNILLQREQFNNLGRQYNVKGYRRDSSLVFLLLRSESGSLKIKCFLLCAKDDFMTLNNCLCLCRVLLGCSCCSTEEDPLVDVARGLANKMKDKTHWAAGRVGDIDFIGPTKTRGKVRLNNANN